MKKIAVFGNDAVLDSYNGYRFAFGFYRFLSRYYEITMVFIRLMPFAKNISMKLSPSMTVHVVYTDENFFFEGKDIRDLFDLALVGSQSPTLVRRILGLVGDAEVIICDSFVWGKFVTDVFYEKIILIRSLDVEQDQVNQAYSSKSIQKDETRLGRELFKKKIIELEGRAYEGASHCFALTYSDAKRLSELYKVPLERFSVLPLCIENIDLYRGFCPVKRKNNTEIINVVYIGFMSNATWSDFDILLSAVEQIPSVFLHIIGKYDKSRTKHSRQIIFYGEISEEKKREIILGSDFALNLSSRTFGMHTKLLDYMLLGCPIISTRIGVRGYVMEEYVHYFPCEKENLPECMRRFVALPLTKKNEMARKAYNLLFEFHDYKKYLENISDKIQGINERREFKTSEKKRCSFIIFGCGDVGYQALQCLKKNGNVCLGFTDNNSYYEGKYNEGYKIFSPKNAISMVNNNQDIRIIIATNVSQYLKEIYTQICRQIVTKEKIYFYYSGKIHSLEITERQLQFLNGQ